MSRGDFTPQADAYARARPGYPEEMLDRLLAEIDLSPGARVADLGAGTGIWTEMLADRGFEVSAVEPNAAMRARAAVHPRILWVDGTFEETRLEDASQHWIVAAQAFHWAKPARALPELRRVSAAGGPLTVLWNNRDVDESDVLRFTREAIERRVPEFDEGYRRRDWAAVLTSTGDFREPREISVRHVVSMSRERYLDLWRSHNLLNNAAGPSAMRGLLDEIERYLGDRPSVEIPYLCRAWTVRAA